MLLRLLEKSDVADSVRQERIGVREAHEIAKVEDPNQRRDLLDRTAQGELNREAVRQAVRLVQRQAEFEEPREVLVTTGDSNDEGEKGRYVTVDRSESDLTPEHELEDIDYSKPISWPNMYDPLPNLRASLRRLEKIRPDRFEDIDTFTMGDVSAALKEIIARAQHMLKQIEEPWEPPQEDDDN
jgi:hypothetical protein